MTETFNQTAYWINRHERFAGDPRSVGNAGKSVEENVKGDQIIAGWVREAAALLSDYKDVLDIGCGYGRVAPAFCDQGFSYHGVDCSPMAIQQAKQRMKGYSTARFEVADLATWQPTRKYDLVCAIFVFVHFVDHSAWHRMLERVLGWLRPGGALLLVEGSFAEQIGRPAEHAKPRLLEAYEAVLSEMGFAWRHDFTQQIAARLPEDAKRPTWNCRLACRVAR